MVAHANTLYNELRTEYEYLDRGCRSVGATATMFRTAKFAFYIVTLGVVVYLIQYAGVEPFVAMGFAVLLISGPEGLETWLIHRGKLNSGVEHDDQRNANEKQ